MTVGEWLATREPAPPRRLMELVRAALGDAADDDARFTTDRCLDAAERVVAELLRQGRTRRESAADLLAADALVTYAFEAAGADPGTVVERAQAATLRLARLGAAPPSSRATDGAPRAPGRA